MQPSTSCSRCSELWAELRLCHSIGMHHSVSFHLCLVVDYLLACQQVAVPKNTVLVVTREKGGYLSMLQSSLSAGRQPDPRLQEVRPLMLLSP